MIVMPKIYPVICNLAFSINNLSKKGPGINNLNLFSPLKWLDFICKEDFNRKKIQLNCPILVIKDDIIYPVLLS